MGCVLDAEIVKDLIRIIGSSSNLTDVYVQLIQLAEETGCPDLEECRGRSVAFDRALRRVHPEWNYLQAGEAADAE